MAILVGTSFFLYRMADSLDDRHGTSDDYYDPYCDLCFKPKGLNVKAWGYCKECYQFLCTDCNIFHGNLQAARGHTVLRGEDMPQSQDAKPPRFEDCEVHPKHVKNQFCFEHQILICLSCSSANHKSCSVSSVDDACQNIQPAEIDTLLDKMNDLRKGFEKISSSLDDNMKSLIQEKEMMVNEAKELYQKIISKADKLLRELIDEIDLNYKRYVSALSENQKRIQKAVSRLDTSLNDIAQERGKRGKCIDVKVFLRMHDALREKDLFKNDIEDFNKNLCNVSLSFAASDVIQDFLSSSSAMGDVCATESPLNLSIGTPDIRFPVSPPLSPTVNPQPSPPQAKGQTETQGAAKRAEGSQQTAMAAVTQPRKLGTYQINMECQDDKCWITGIAITKDGKIILADYNHFKVILFSRQMKFLFSLSLSSRVWDVEMTGDKETVVSTYNPKLIFLHISDNKLAIKREVKLPFYIHGITRYKDYLIVTCPNAAPRTVKLIDMTGKVIWSLSTGDTGQTLFKRPWFVSSFAGGKSSSVIVTDNDNHTLTLLNGDTGEVITTHQLERKFPRGVATDNAGNVYVCHFGTGEVAVLSADLSREKILLSNQQGLRSSPQAIAFHELSRQLVISYCGESCIDIYQF